MWHHKNVSKSSIPDCDTICAPRYQILSILNLFGLYRFRLRVICPPGSLIELKHASSAVTDRGAAEGALRRASRLAGPIGQFTGPAREAPLDLAHQPAPERHHADHEDDADDHRNPGADPVREVLLQRDDDVRPNHRPEKGPAAAEQGH